MTVQKEYIKICPLVPHPQAAPVGSYYPSDRTLSTNVSSRKSTFGTRENRFKSDRTQIYKPAPDQYNPESHDSVRTKSLSQKETRFTLPRCEIAKLAPDLYNLQNMHSHNLSGTSSVYASDNERFRLPKESLIAPTGKYDITAPYKTTLTRTSRSISLGSRDSRFKTDKHAGAVPSAAYDPHSAFKQTQTVQRFHSLSQRAQRFSSIRNNVVRLYRQQPEPASYTPRANFRGDKAGIGEDKLRSTKDMGNKFYNFWEIPY